MIFFPKPLECRTNLLQFADAGPFQTAQIKQQDFDIVIFGGIVDSVDQLTEWYLPAGSPAEKTIHQQRFGSLFDDVADRRENQRRSPWNLFSVAE